MTDRKFPNLFLVGVMKSGSTTLHDALKTHPEVFMSAYKEPQYFAGTQYTERVWFDNNPLPDPQGRWYFALFDRARNDPRIKYAGESSMDYTQRPVFEGCAQRIRAFNPEARILCIMRDPVERCISHYWHNVCMLEERRCMLEAVRCDPRLIACSDYAMQLRPYWDAFPRDQIHTLTLESFRDDPEGALREIFEWLGVDANFEVPELSLSNATPEVVYQMRFGMSWLARLRGTRRWRKISRLLPRKFDGAVHRLSLRRLARETVRPLETIEYVRPILAEKTKALWELLGREYPEWKTTFPNGAV